MTVLLLRHAVSESNLAHTLAGRSSGVALAAAGVEQADALVTRLGQLPIEAIVRSPLPRCEQTVEPLAKHLRLEPTIDERLNEVDYGDWTGRAIADLLAEPLWQTVQSTPSQARFPRGEALTNVVDRAASAIRDIDRRLAAQSGADVLWIACSHGDVIKAILADAFGMPFDNFQRINVDPASVSVVTYGHAYPVVTKLNDTAEGPAAVRHRVAVQPGGGPGAVGGK